jgi:hypothetical protein
VKDRVSISLWSFYPEAGLACQPQQIPVPTDQQIGSAALRQVEKWLVVRVPADHRALAFDFNYLAERQKLRQQLVTIDHREPELWIREDASEFRGGRA